MDKNSLEHRKLEVLHEACRIIGKAFDLDNALRDILYVLAEKLRMKRASITLYDEDADRLFIRASYGLSPEEEARGVYAPGEGITGQVFLTGEPCVVLNVKQEPLFLNRTGARKLEREEISFLAVPIMLEDKAIGVLSVDRLFEDGIDYHEDINFLEIVALLVAQFVQLRRNIEKREIHLKQENLLLRTELKKRFSDFMASSRSPEMQKVLTLVRQVAPTRATVLLQGESGTGKTLTARLIHDLSPRAGKPFVKINCASLPENLLEAELFGYEKGAFTGAIKSKPGLLEEAHEGTVFLDEISELSLELQAKLLRFIQEREFERLGSTKTRRVDVRIIAATNRDLENLAREGKFREDLFFRLNVFPIYIPPLRERLEDLPLLINFILRRLSKEYARNLRLTPKAMEIMSRYHWPGNVRELENFLERLFILSENDTVTEGLISSLLKKVLPEKESSLSLEIPPQELSEEEIIEVLKRHNFIIARAAKELGLTFRQLRYRIQCLGIEEKIPLRRGRPPKTAYHGK
ncbi:sigma 54-interacting transcriptional regulator [Thermodesulfatator autotrophicus]|uniref:Nif-specific transcriptional activator NifA n=1 Tax=Thermodesulfatator autotrophicus TaxID=1795632 RepID=A0A177E949_9BACT|nr:sigma 54-interacting transcriptional regulator [Thermodesulfatator autotrophicus]OAG28477.1 nif-specific transcriptional activator NifA [Thermodesulfatator autotrophicus]